MDENIDARDYSGQYNLKTNEETTKVTIELNTGDSLRLAALSEYFKLSKEEVLYFAFKKLYLNNMFEIIKQKEI